MASEIRELANIVAQIIKAYSDGQAENNYKSSSEYVISRLINECGYDLEGALRDMERSNTMTFDSMEAAKQHTAEIRECVSNVTYVLKLLGSFRDESTVRLRAHKKISTDNPGGAEFKIGK